MKPKSCLDCPAVHITKKLVVCSCYKVLQASPKDYEQLDRMNKGCIIDWNAEEGGKK